jgi:heme-degrading monooxygenase HmoA
VYAIVFEYRVPPGGIDRFERAYGADGGWAAFFRRSDAYLGTDLYRHADVSGRYVLVDRWVSEDAYRSFLEEHAAEFDELDRRHRDDHELEVRLGGLTVPAG